MLSDITLGFVLKSDIPKEVLEDEETLEEHIERQVKLNHL